VLVADGTAKNKSAHGQYALYSGAILLNTVLLGSLFSMNAIAIIKTPSKPSVLLAFHFN
jgi:hypothetical protein